MELEVLKTLFSVLGRLVMAGAYLGGLVLCGTAIWIKFGQISSGGRSNNPNSAVWTFFAGLALSLSPVLYGMTMKTFVSDWDSTSSLYQIDAAALSDLDENKSALFSFLPNESVFVLAMFIYGIGLYAYIKGLYLLRYGGTMGQDGRTQAGRAWGHIFGGIAVMNIQSISCLLLGFFIKLSYC